MNKFIIYCTTVKLVLNNNIETNPSYLQLGVVTEQGCQPPSNCLPNGRYAPVQCKGDMFTGR